MITIKKYPNRRLYDTSKSQYINLEAIKEMVMAHTEFEVVDSKTGESLTKSILLQIISEQEGDDQQAVLTQTVLKQLIRFYDSDMQGVMRHYLEQSISMFLERQEVMRSAMTDILDKTSPLNIFNQMLESNVSLWRNFTQMDPHGPPQKGSAGVKPGPEDENSGENGCSKEDK